MALTNVSALADMNAPCDCGRTHKVPIKKITTGHGVLGALADMLVPFAGKRVFLIGDNNTMPLAQEAVQGMLAEKKCDVTSYTFISERHLILNERLIGSMLIRMPTPTDLIVTIGSGTLNDLSRVIGTRCNIPYIIIGTAPSMDGYASTVSPVVMDGGKLSIPLSVPYGIIADTQLMKTAPDEMLSSGVGDILGKYVALCDWKLARREMDEYFCAAIADMIDTALTRCVNGIAKLGGRDPEAVLAMADTLIMSGVAISMHGISRPASGCEHQLAHYWEVALLDGDADCPLHGNFVGFGTEVACRLYEMAGKEFDLVFPYRLPTSDEIRGYMRLLGDYSSIKTLGITRDLLYDSFFHATEANGRYTLITFLKDKGRLDYYAKAITDSYFSA